MGYLQSLISLLGLKELNRDGFHATKFDSEKNLTMEDLWGKWTRDFRRFLAFFDKRMDVRV